MIKDFIPQGFCLECRECCKFSEAESPWSPVFLHEEIEKIVELSPAGTQLLTGNKLNLVFSEQENIYLCPFLNSADNKCNIYAMRPFECRLYPFLINRKGDKVFLAIDLNCPFAKDNFQRESLQEYVEYLKGVFSSAHARQILKNNPQIIQTYPGIQDLAELV